MRLGKIEKRLLLDTYEKTVEHKIPYGWYMSWDYSFSHMIMRRELRLNWFKGKFDPPRKCQNNGAIFSDLDNKGKIAIASLSRAISSLKVKGLVIKWRGTRNFSLTLEGEETAKKLLNEKYNRVRLKVNVPSQ